MAEPLLFSESARQKLLHGIYRSYHAADEFGPIALSTVDRMLAITNADEGQLWYTMLTSGRLSSYHLAYLLYYELRHVQETHAAAVAALEGKIQTLTSQLDELRDQLLYIPGNDGANAAITRAKELATMTLVTGTE